MKSKVRNIKKSKRKKKKLKGKILAILAVIALIIAWMAPATLNMLSAKRQNEQLKKELTLIEEQNKELKKIIKKLYTKEYNEIEARKLGYVMKGEKAYNVIQKNVKVKKKAPLKKISWWDNLTDKIRSLF